MRPARMRFENELTCKKSAEEMNKSIYSHQFNLLKLWGAWPLENPSPSTRKFFLRYSISMLVCAICLVYMGILNFIQELNDFRKLSWNICVNLVVVITLVKNVYMYRHSEEINDLRRRVHRDIETCDTEKRMKIYLKNVEEFKTAMKGFHYPYFVFVPLWIGDCLRRQIQLKEPPLPVNWYWELDDSVQNQMFIYFLHIVYASFFLYHAFTTDLAIYGIMFQIYREYEFVQCEVEELKNSVEADEELKGIPSFITENRQLKINQTKLRLKMIVQRQRDVIRSTEEFERLYNGLMMVQILFGGGLVLMNWVQTLTFTIEFNTKITTQGAYVCVIVLDGYILCLLGDRISEQCRRVGDAIYDLPWYDMDVALRKDLLLIIVRSQKPVKITSGKLFNLNLEMYSETLKNIYQLTTVFRQFGFS